MEQAMKRVPAAERFHGVRFYENDEPLCRTVAECRARGIVPLHVGRPGLMPQGSEAA